MKTCCPGCQTVFRVSSEQLKARAGKVRCGQCRKVFNAIEGLVDDGEAVVSAPLAAAPDGGEGSTATPTVAVLLRQQEADDGSLELPAASSASASRDGDVAEALTGSEPAASPPDSPPDSTPDSPLDSTLELPPDLPVITATPAEPAAMPESAALASIGMVVPGETREAAGHDRWLEGAISKPVSATAGKRPSGPFVIAIVLLLLLLIGQLIFHFRGTIVLIAPSLRPALAVLSTALGTTIPLPRHADLVSIEASDLQSEAGRNKLLALQATLRNRASYAQALPAIELTLTAADDKAVVRRVFMPEEYLPPSALAEGSFPANGDLDVRLTLDAKEVDAAGYRLYVFYP